MSYIYDYSESSTLDYTHTYLNPHYPPTIPPTYFPSSPITGALPPLFYYPPTPNTTTTRTYHLPSPPPAPALSTKTTTTTSNTVTNSNNDNAISPSNCPYHHHRSTCLPFFHCCRSRQRDSSSSSSSRTCSHHRSSSPHVHFATAITGPSRSHSHSRSRSPSHPTLLLPIQEVLAWNSAPLYDYRLPIAPDTTIDGILRALGVGGREARLYSGSGRRSWMLGELQEGDVAEALRRVRGEGAYIEVIRR